MFTRKKYATLDLPHREGVLLLVDWDNLFYNLFSSFKAEGLRLNYRLKKLIEWLENEIGEIAGGHGFVFAPEHLSSYHQQICLQNGFKLIICPKIQATEVDAKERDTVDETIIWFGKMMMRHPDVKTICLVSGDDDFVPLFEEAEKCGVRRALAPPTLNSLSKSKRLIRLVSKHSRTRRKMLLRLDTDSL